MGLYHVAFERRLIFWPAGQFSPNARSRFLLVHDGKDFLQRHLLEELTTPGRGRNQREPATFTAFDKALEKQQSSQEGTVHMGATAQIHGECRRAASEALIGKLAHRRAVL